MSAPRPDAQHDLEDTLFPLLARTEIGMPVRDAATFGRRRELERSAHEAIARHIEGVVPDREVHVHIGRVAVRAVAPSPAPPRRTARCGPTLSLDAYLESRDRSRP